MIFWKPDLFQNFAEERDPDDKDVRATGQGTVLQSTVALMFCNLATVLQKLRQSYVQARAYSRAYSRAFAIALPCFAFPVLTRTAPTVCSCSLSLLAGGTRGSTTSQWSPQFQNWRRRGRRGGVLDTSCRQTVLWRCPRWPEERTGDTTRSGFPSPHLEGRG